MNSIFLFENILDAKHFISKDKREGEIIYKIRIFNEKAVIHRASMKLYERIPMNRPVLSALIEQARQYWKGINKIDADFQAELLVESPVEVIERIIS
jgi:hypothetical protein